MENSKNNSGLKAVILILLLLLGGSVAYIFKTQNENKDSIEVLNNEKEVITAELAAKIAEYDLLIAENSTLKEDFEAQRTEMVNLLGQIKSAKGDAASMAKYKNEYIRLKREMETLKEENLILKAENVALTSTLDSTKTEMQEVVRLTDTLMSQNDKLAKKVTKASKLSVLNLNVMAVKEKNSGKEIVTDKASRVNKLKISFVIAENAIADKGDRIYYAQIIDAKGNVLGDKQTIPVTDSVTLTYSFKTKIGFDNKTVQVNESIKGDDFEKGTYFVKLFDIQGNIVSSTSFDLR